jgi:transposase-like protein
MVRDQGLSVGQVCRDMNLADSGVRRWLEQFDEEAAGRPGSQYASSEHAALIASNGLIASMERVWQRDYSGSATTPITPKR